MAITFLQLFAPNIVDNAAPETLFTIPASPGTNLLRNGRVRFSNYTAGAVTIEAWSVPSGDTEGDDNICLPVTSLPANSYLDLDIPVLAAGGFFSAQAGAATSITATQLDGFIQS